MPTRARYIPEGRPKWISENGIDVIDGPLVITKKELPYFATICSLMTSGNIAEDAIIDAAKTIVGACKIKELEEVLQKYSGPSVPLWSRDPEGNYQLNIDEFMIEY